MKDSKRYLRKIRTLLPVWGSYEKRFYKDIRSNVTEFCNVHPDYTYSDLGQLFASLILRLPLKISIIKSMTSQARIKPS